MIAIINKQPMGCEAHLVALLLWCLLAMQS